MSDSNELDLGIMMNEFQRHLRRAIDSHTELSCELYNIKCACVLTQENTKNMKSTMKTIKACVKQIEATTKTLMDIKNKMSELQAPCTEAAYATPENLQSQKEMILTETIKEDDWFTEITLGDTINQDDWCKDSDDDI